MLKEDLNNIRNVLKDKQLLKKKLKATLKETVETVVFVVVMVIIIKFFIGEIRWIPSSSMHPTLLEGDRIFVERFHVFMKHLSVAILWYSTHLWFI